MLEINDKVTHILYDKKQFVLKSVNDCVALCVDSKGKEFKFDIKHLRKC